MRLTIMIFSLFAVLGLAGCHAHGYKHPHNGDFCPPGQAKKGNC